MSRKDKKKDEEVLNTTNEDRVLADDEDVETIDDIQKREKEEKKIEKKETKQKKRKFVKDSFNIYKFIFKIITFALLVSLGIFILIKQDEAIGMIYMATGIIIAGFALIRLIPLFKTLKHHRSRIVSLVEIIIHIVLGAYLIAGAFIHWNVITQEDVNKALAIGTVLEKSNDFLCGMKDFNIAAYSYIVVIALWSRALCHFWLVDLYQEPTTKVNFWLHAVSMTAAVVIGCLAQHITPAVIVILLVVLCFSSALVIGGEAAGGYILYRRTIAGKQEKKEEKKEEGQELPAPKEEEINEVDPNIIPQTDNDQETAIIN